MTPAAIDALDERHFDDFTEASPFTGGTKSGISPWLRCRMI